MNWNRATVLARRNAILKRNVASAHFYRFLDALDMDEFSLLRLREDLYDLVEQYKVQGKTELAEDVDKLVESYLEDIDYASKIDFLRDSLDAVADDYRRDGEIEQADQLDALIKINSFGYEHKEEWCGDVADFFDQEVNFFNGLIHKYDRFLKNETAVNGPNQLEIYFDQYLY